MTPTDTRPRVNVYLFPMDCPGMLANSAHDRCPIQFGRELHPAFSRLCSRRQGLHTYPTGQGSGAGLHGFAAADQEAPNRPCRRKGRILEFCGSGLRCAQGLSSIVVEVLQIWECHLRGLRTPRRANRVSSPRCKWTPSSAAPAGLQLSRSRLPKGEVLYVPRRRPRRRWRLWHQRCR